MTEWWAPKIYAPDGFIRTPFLNGAKALDVGCGGRKLIGAVGMDVLALPSVDVVHNSNCIPWPFPDQTFDLVLLNHSLEHLEDIVQVMDEIHRISKPGAHIVIQVPHFRSVGAYTDPTHKHFFTSKTLDYFIDGEALSHYHYSKRLFRKCGFWYGWPHPSKNPFVQAIKSFIHSHSNFYEKYLSLIAPTKCLTWELEKIS